ncbi:MAG: hypothetical protein QNJ54_03345 [Prochloraceae cyanobacterium]|nr:hypothetical protein [Prochloraceae cyanobacterium]
MIIADNSTICAQLIDYLPIEQMSHLVNEQLIPAITVLAQGYQDIEDIDVIAQMQDAYNNFIQSGQVWALGIGVVLGYIFRAFTAY